MKLAVIITGGTIGSKCEQGWIAPNREAPYLIIEKYRKQYPIQAKDVSFEVRMPYQILSENLNGDYLNRLIQEVKACIQEDVYQGIVICHGTDTLAYTSTMLDWALQKILLPVVLVSSNYPLEDLRANGLENFRFGVETVRQGIAGVSVVYQNKDKKTYVHMARKVLAHQTFEDELYSMHQAYVGVYDEKGDFCVMPPRKDTCRELPDIEYHGLQKHSEFIKWIRSYPGMCYPELDKTIKAVMIESYHSGTIAVGEELEKFTQNAKELEIPIYLVGATKREGGYETMKEYQRLGIEVLENLTPISVYCYLWMRFSEPDA